jgi:hypothetical protein
MATGGGDIQKKLYRHTACFTPIEHALLMTQVELAAVSISTYLKCGPSTFLSRAPPAGPPPTMRT